MSKICNVPGEGVLVFVAVPDHCDPHVHCQHRADGWYFKVGFSYLDGSLVPYDLKPGKGNRRPTSSTVKAVMNEVGHRLKKCRDEWWRLHGVSCGTCLDNRHVVVSAATVALTSSKKGARIRQVASSRYDPKAHATTVVLNDGSRRVVSL